MAVAMPGATFVGVDLAAEPVARGAALAAELGLANVHLLQADIAALPEDLGSFDYIAAHGVYSWIPPGPRDALLAAMRRHLAPRGVAYVSYNAYPGSYLRDMARDVLRFHVEHVRDPEQRIAQARALMELIVRAGREPALAGYMERLLSRPGWLVFHDELADVNTPVYFHEFARHAARHGLQFLAESHLADSRLQGLPDDVARGLEAALPDDVLVREQYIDFVANRMFRQTLLCHEAIAVRRTLRAEDVMALWVSSPARAEGDGAALDGPEPVRFSLGASGEVETADPAFKRMLDRLGRVWPAALRFTELAGDRPQRLGEALLAAHAERIVELHVEPPPVVSRPGARPCASSLARRQVVAGESPVTTLRHDQARLPDERDRALLALLDGTRDRDALARESGLDATDVDARLARMAWFGLLRA
jgi:SAM-dependent methyltransferase